MIENLDLAKGLFLDIETVPGFGNPSELDEELLELWRLKCRSMIKKQEGEPSIDEASAIYMEKAGIFAEFGKIICISFGGFVNDENGMPELKMSSYYGDDEKEILLKFSNFLEKRYPNPDKNFLCGHNIKEFDIPYICRRMLIHRLTLPRMLDISGKKPWETKHLVDTLELWKFGDNKNYTSLRMLTYLFGIPSPKDDIDGSEVSSVYWNDHNVERIKTYCEKDVKAVVELIKKFRGS